MITLPTLKDLAAGDALAAGGKAARLAELAQAGFPVPAGFCIPASRFGDGRDPGARLPEGLAEAVVAACRALAPDADARWAVRSSALGEDSFVASFAGQGESFLDVPTAEVSARVRDCWLSLASPRAQAYGERWGSVTGVGVLVQRMLAPSAAGVAFSRDPVDDRPVVVVEAVPGRGDRLAQGTETPHRYVVDSQSVAAPNPDGVLAASEVKAIAGVVKKVEATLGWPVDVEWALAGGQVYLLQARPLSARGEESFFTETVPEDEQLWTAGFVNERFPAPVSPLGWTTVREHFERLALREPLAFLGHPGAWRMPVTKLHHGHPYVAVEAIAGLYKAVPDALLPEDAARFFPGGDTSLRREAAYPRSRLDPRLWLALARTLLREPGNWSPLHNHRVWRRFRRGYEAELARIAAGRRQNAGAGELLVEVAVVQSANARLLAIHRWSLTHADLWYSLLRRLGRSWLGAAWQSAVAALVRGADQVSVALDAELHGLAASVDDLPGGCKALAGAQSVAGLRARLRHSPRGEAWFKRFEAFLCTYGHRSYSLDIHQPGFAADPRQVFSLLATLSENGGEHRQSNPEADPAAGGLAVLRFWQRPIFGAVLGLARRYLRLREEQRFAWQRGLAAIRDLYLGVGEQLTVSNHLAAADDIFFLTAPEVAQAVAGKLGPDEARRLAIRRRREHAALVAAQQADQSGSYPPFLYGQEPLAASGARDNSRLGGTPVSSGLAIGRVRVVRDPAELARVHPGEVLVAPSVDPGWTPVFGKVAALVTECGGQLSHPAVVAREYSLPAVLAVHGATSALRDGDLVLVDGSAGTVTRLEGEETKQS